MPKIPEVSLNLDPKQVTDLLIRISVVALVLYFSLKVFSPFLSLVIWGLILAIALFPIHQKMARVLGNRQGRTSTAMVLLGFILLGLPFFLLTKSFVIELNELRDDFKENRLSVPPPKESVSEWPARDRRKGLHTLGKRLRKPAGFHG